MSQSELEKLKALIASDAEILKGIAGGGDVKAAAKALADFAATRGIQLTADEIEGVFAARAGSAPTQMEPLDDDALDHVSGGGSPYCIYTKGCYCIFTK
ncbi:Nif11-like leader peptide family natural product precursor [Nitrospirillum amazonense]|uniref:Uncharacterized protein n=1 Tax=Nitrospirillum amazonense TaxID=28077 RepID=A0A560K4B2_9PROT|nr:Nif11-like leader peptide family natural product precursor [Nitrospirillum amazonense]MDG3444283.1 Nif11-like leader peptide family natural product precursor [Nitrospirillum amazonense]TWB77839.1 hypothetical protein FBZ87_103659 [Nitrospirillum amazonense]